MNTSNDMQRLRFFGRAMARGWTWLVEAWSHITLVVALLGAVGFGVFAGIHPHRWWAVAVYLAVVVGVCFFEGCGCRKPGSA